VCDLLLFVLYRVYVEFWKLCLIYYCLCVIQGLCRVLEAVCDLLLFVLYTVYIEYWKLCVIYYCLCYTGFM